MTLRIFYFFVLSVLMSIIALSVMWEFWLEDIVLPQAGFHHEPEETVQRWEFVVTAVVFSAIALVAPTIVGTRIILRDKALQDEVTRLSQEDHLTGLLNRRRMTQLLDNEIRRALRYGTTFSVIMIDIDHFKAVNDQFGHQAGDAVLKTIADVIKTSLRAPDFVGRWGGEEFIILLPQTNIAGGISLAEKTRTRLQSTEFHMIGHVTASFGVSSFNEGDDIGSVIARADAGLYAAKKQGRNRVEAVNSNKEGRHLAKA